MSNVVAFPRQLPTVAEHVIIEARANHPGCPNGHMLPYWVEWWDGYPDSDTIVVWQAHTHDEARRVVAEIVKLMTS